jgi:hypothetical protein
MFYMSALTMRPYSYRYFSVLLLGTCLFGLFFQNSFAAKGGGGGGASGNSGNGNSGSSSDSSSSGGGSSSGSGSVSLGGTILSYDALKLIGVQIADDISSRLKCSKDARPTLYITSLQPNSGGNQALLEFLRQNFTNVKAEMETRIPTNGQANIFNTLDTSSNAFAMPAVAGDMVTGLATLVGLLQTTITGSANNVPPDNLALSAAIEERLKEKANVILPDLFVDGSYVAHSNSLLSVASAALGQRGKAGAYIAATNKNVLTAEEKAKEAQTKLELSGLGRKV